ncbi:MAG: hypothetical protein M3R36_00940 [Bacteroidota bacterium]|nr:hypothetical protein [Bacteroidota bacterium]
MIDLSRIKKYFTYDDKLRAAVSVITGVLIAVFNAISGVVIVYAVFDMLIRIHNRNFLIQILYFISGLIAGAAILRMNIFIVELIIRRIEIEDYSYLRLLLLVSIGVYLLIFIFYSLLFVTITIKSNIYDMII